MIGPAGGAILPHFLSMLIMASVVLASFRVPAGQGDHVLWRFRVRWTSVQLQPWAWQPLRSQLRRFDVARVQDVRPSCQRSGPVSGSSSKGRISSSWVSDSWSPDYLGKKKLLRGTIYALPYFKELRSQQFIWLDFFYWCSQEITIKMKWINFANG